VVLQKANDVAWRGHGLVKGMFHQSAPRIFNSMGNVAGCHLGTISTIQGTCR
jgi:hypothetical protein